MESVPDLPWLPGHGQPPKPTGRIPGRNHRLNTLAIGIAARRTTRRSQCTFAECAMSRPAPRWPLIGADPRQRLLVGALARAADWLADG